MFLALGQLDDTDTNKKRLQAFPSPDLKTH